MKAKRPPVQFNATIQLLNVSFAFNGLVAITALAEWMAEHASEINEYGGAAVDAPEAPPPTDGGP